MASDKRQVILDTASDLMASFLYYDRKEDEDLGRGEIEAAITQGVVTLDELVAIFRKALEGATNEPRTIKGPCFDCDDALDDAWEFCPCRRHGLRSTCKTAPTPKIEPDDLRPNVPPRMM